MKSCLKTSSSSPTPLSETVSATKPRSLPKETVGTVRSASPRVSTRPQCYKTVSFRCESEDDADEVYIADEWDRTPVSVTPKLTYQDILELKEMQMSMCRQNPRTMGSNFTPLLCNVPVGLLPLLPDISSTKMPPTPTSPTPLHVDEKDVTRPLSPPTTPPRRAPAPIPAPPLPRARNFAFLPLLDSPESQQSPAIRPSSPKLASAVAKLDLSSSNLTPTGARPDLPPSPPLEKERSLNGPPSPRSYFPPQPSQKAGPSPKSSPSTSSSVAGSLGSTLNTKERVWNKPSDFFPSRTRSPSSSSLHQPLPQRASTLPMARSVTPHSYARPSSPTFCPPSPPIEYDWRTLPSTVGLKMYNKDQNSTKNPQRSRVYWGEGDEDWGDD